MVPNNKYFRMAVCYSLDLVIGLPALRLSDVGLFERLTFLFLYCERSLAVFVVAGTASLLAGGPLQ